MRRTLSTAQLHTSSKCEHHLIGRLEFTDTTPSSPGNLSQVPPICADLMFEDVFANPFAAAIIEGMLGPHPEVRYLHGNTAMGGEERQDVHADLAWRHWHWPFGLVVK